MSQDPAADRSEQVHNPYAPIGDPAASTGGGSPAPLYGQAPAYGQPPAYGQVPSYGQQPVYSQTPVPGHQPYPATSAGAAPAYGVGQVPSYGAPTYGYPPAQPYAPLGDWDTPRTDSMSVAAFVVALSGFLILVTFPVGLGLGIAGMVRAKRRHVGGRGLAVAAVVIGAFGTVVMLGAITLGLIGAFRSGAFTDSRTSSAPKRADTTSSTTLPDYRLVQGLTPGECLQGDPTSWSLADAVPVSCTQDHNLEVVSVYQLSTRPADDTKEPGAELDQAQSTCENDVLAANSSLLRTDDWSDVWGPHPDQWDAGETSAYCLWGTDSSVRGSATQGFGAQGSGV